MGLEFRYSVYDLLLYMMIYGFVGWAVEVCLFALLRKRWINRGFISLPLSLRCGATAVILMLVLPTLHGNLLLQYVMSLTVWLAVRSLGKQFIRSANRERADRRVFDGPLPIWQDMLTAICIAGVYLAGYLVVHPLAHSLRLLLPELAVRAAALTGAALMAADVVSTVYFLRTSRTAAVQERQRGRTSSLAERMRVGVTARLERAYPGIFSDTECGERAFAGGVCTDKLIWVFLVSSFLGALIEMAYCRLSGGVWMNRSSVLYGAFSFVWGFGAVVLTIMLQRIADRSDRYVFAAGFVIGGAYEYVCSVFTELVFGTVFWDYSAMPMNIGGRTNVLYCMFWGVLAVVWIKGLYPLMSRAIERIPPLPGKILTWLLALVMACNGLLTCAAMIRHTQRRSDPVPGSAFARFLDTRYDDAWMEERWPNMTFVLPEESDGESREMDAQ